MSYALHMPISRACTCLQYVFFKVTCVVYCLFHEGMFDIASCTWPLANAKETQGSEVRKKSDFLLRLGLKKTGADNVLATQEKVQTQSLEETVKDLSAKVKQLQSEVDNMTLEKDEALEKLRSDLADSKTEWEKKNVRIEELDESLANASTRIASLLEENKDLRKQLAEAGSAEPEPDEPGTSRQTRSAAAMGEKEKGKEKDKGKKTGRVKKGSPRKVPKSDRRRLVEKKWRTHAVQRYDKNAALDYLMKHPLTEEQVGRLPRYIPCDSRGGDPILLQKTFSENRRFTHERSLDLKRTMHNSSMVTTSHANTHLHKCHITNEGRKIWTLADGDTLTNQIGGKTKVSEFE